MAGRAPIEDKMNRIIDALVRKSEASALRWAETASESVFLAHLDPYGISVEKSFPPLNVFDQAFGARSRSEAAPRYILSLLDGEGNEIEALTERVPKQGKFDELERLFSLARRSARNVDEGLDTILRALEE